MIEITHQIERLGLLYHVCHLRMYNVVVQSSCGGGIMETVSISDFRANLLKYLEKANKGQQITVTTNGRVLATISPPVQMRETAKSQLAGLAATAKIHDVINPIETDWDATS